MGAFKQSPFDESQGLNVGSWNSQDEFVGYGTAFNNPDRFKLQMKERIHLINPTMSPFLSWASMVRKVPVAGTYFTWMEDELFTHRDIKAKLKYWHDEGLVTLQILNGGDWQAFEAAAAGDTWLDTKPLIHMIVKDQSGSITQTPAFVILQPGLYKGPGTRSYTTGAASVVTLQNEIVLYDVTDTRFGGATAYDREVTSVPDDAGTDWNADVYTNMASGDYGYDKQFTVAAWDGAGTDDVTTDVYVQVITPNEYLGGYAQGSGLPNESRKRSRTFGNYTQIFKTPYSVANTLLAVEMYGPSELARLRLRKAGEHKVDIERAIFFQGGGTEHTDYGILPQTGASNPLTRFKGLGVGALTKAAAGCIATKNGDWETDLQFNSSTADISALNALCSAVFDDTVDSPSSTKVVFCSQKWLLALSNMASRGFGSTSITPHFGYRDQGANSLGINITDLHSPVGNLRFVHQPLLRGQYENYAVVIDFSNIEIRPLRGRDTTLHANVGARDLDGRLDYYITELGFECRHESTHAVLKLTG